MSTGHWLLAILGELVVVSYALGSGYWVQTSGSWYENLRKPRWQPPDIVFGLIWPYHFICLGIAAFRIPQTLRTTSSLCWLASFAASVVAALIWSQRFYGPHKLRQASIALATAAILTIPVTVIPWQVSWRLGLALLPYQIWLCIATALSSSYARLNQKSN